MPAFNRFGVWDKEVREFIATLNTQESLKDSAAAINEWFYSDGFAAFIKHQGDVNDIFMRQETELTKLRPHVSDLHMLGQKVEGFDAVWPAFKAKFLMNIATKEALLIHNLYKIFAYDAVHTHKRVYAVQAYVMNQYSDKLNNKELDPKNTFKFLIDNFNKAKEKYHDAVEDIDNHIKTLEEYFAYVMARKESKDSTQTTSVLRSLSTFPERTERQIQMLQTPNTEPAAISNNAVNASFATK